MLTPASDPLLRFRAEFPILERTNYLVSNSLGAMPRTVPERLAEYARKWAEEGVRAWTKGWWEMPVEAGSEIAPLLGADSGDVVMFPNVSIAQAAIVSALDYTAPRDAIVTTALDFPSVRYVYDALATRLGARIVEVPSEDGIGIDHDRLLEAIDERTRLVAVSHVLFRSAYVLDADRICRRAREVGALVALDAFHSVGVLPVDVKRSGTDFLTGGVLKWLCGGPGGCFLYVSPETRERYAPAITGWQAHARPFAFETEMDFTTGAFRWLNGTPVIPALYAAVEGPRIVRSAGMAEVRAKSLRQTSRLITMADSRGYRVHAARDAERRGGTVAFSVPHGYEVAQSLLAQNIMVDYRPEAGIRIAPHFYNSDDELESAVAAIDAALESGAWRQYEGKAAVVT
ncbi:MAG: aminotransferase class V-fold PLP-dependent enzyme [Anaerolineae bacterium]|nr:aminotransferase class V-fold PLP-dependent enzyme [Gemmatimonadaceae bacterium]